jgi:endonuclease/exonuclease/phosphatase family metal-dependent hydrolase
MIDKGIALVKSVNADIVALQEMLAMPHVDSDQRQRIGDLIAQNKAWLAKWDLQNKIAMKGNTK